MAGPTPARPTAITIIAVLALIGGIVLILGGLALIGLGGVAAAVGAAGAGGLAFLWGLVTIVEGVAELAIAYGFWTLKAWAWRLGVILAFASVVLSIVGIVFRGFDLVNIALTIVIAAVWIYYLNLPSVRTLFGAPASGLPIVGNALDPYLNRVKM
jgi:hypothetical protein